jgi:hypothetical protein
VAIPTVRNVVEKEAENKLKYKSLCGTNVEPKMHYYTSNNWSHWNSNEKHKKKFGSCIRKTFN